MSTSSVDSSQAFTTVAPIALRPLSEAEEPWEELFRAAESVGGRDWRHGTRLRYLVRDWDQYLLEARRGGPVDGKCVCEESLVDLTRSSASDIPDWRGSPMGLMRT